MRDEPRALYAKTRQLFEELCPLVERVGRMLPMERDILELADAALALKKAHEMLDRLWTDVNQAHETAVKLTCLIYCTSAKYQDGSPIRTDYCIATPDVKMMASLPNKKKEPELYAKLMTHMGVPEALWNAPDGAEEAVRPHFNGMIDYLTRRMREGKPLPEGINPDKTYAMYKLTTRLKKGVTITQGEDSGTNDTDEF